MLSLDYFLQLLCLKCDEVILDDCLLFNHDSPVTYYIHLLLVFVFNSCFLCKEPALMGSCPSWFPAILVNKYCCCCRPNCMCDFSVDNFFDKCIYALSKKCCHFGVVKTDFFQALQARSAAPRRNDRN